MLRRGHDRLDQQQVEAIWGEIRRQVEKRDQVEREKRPMPRSLQELTLGGLGCLVAALVGLMTIAVAGLTTVFSKADDRMTNHQPLGSSPQCTVPIFT